MQDDAKDFNDPVDILLVAIGGYGVYYVLALDAPATDGHVRIRGVVDPHAQDSEAWEALSAAGVPRYDTIDEFLLSGKDADLAVISSPIALHAEHTNAALGAGMNVLCEKPLTANIDDAYGMIEARDKAKRFLEIGYQWSFNRSIQRFKADIMAGRFGRPRRFSAWVAWPRSSAYYARNNWAGRICDDAGHFVFDSPANNATAHYLHNMLYLLGPDIDLSATPTAITGECYRAHPVENFDAACCRIETRENTEILFYTAHCVQKRVGPISRFEFDNAVAIIQESGDLIVRFSNGREEDYGNANKANKRKLNHCIERCRAVDGGRTLCGPEAALAQTLCINGLQQMPVTTLAGAEVAQGADDKGEILAYVPGLEEIMRQCHEHGILFSEMTNPAITWSGKPVRVELS